MPSTIPSIAALRAELGVATRLSGADSSRTLEARRALAAAVLEKRVREVIRNAPPLSDEQRSRIVNALNPATRRGTGSVSRSAATPTPFREGGATHSRDTYRATEVEANEAGR